MGAYELAGVAPPDVLIGDINGDGLVGSEDLLVAAPRGAHVTVAARRTST